MHFSQTLRRARSLVGILALVPLLLFPIQGFAQSSGAGKTGLPLPRFVSLKSNKANMRVGPGSQYEVRWRYVKKGLPMEIVEEFGNWRQVRDPEGNEGWMLHSLLSGKRTAIISPWEKDPSSGRADLKAEADSASTTLAIVEPGVVGNVEACKENWCRINIRGKEGYVGKSKIWGVYPDELIEE